jgi:hypothetical protein
LYCAVAESNRFVWEVEFVIIVYIAQSKNMIFDTSFHVRYDIESIAVCAADALGFLSARSGVSELSEEHDFHIIEIQMMEFLLLDCHQFRDCTCFLNAGRPPSDNDESQAFPPVLRCPARLVDPSRIC